MWLGPYYQGLQMPKKSRLKPTSDKEPRKYFRVKTCPECFHTEEELSKGCTMWHDPRVPVPLPHMLWTNSQEIKAHTKGNHFLYLFPVLKWWEGSHFLGSLFTCEWYIIIGKRDFSKIKEGKQLIKITATQSGKVCTGGIYFKHWDNTLYPQI